MLKFKANSEIYSAIKIQLRVIIALVLRETRTTFGNSALGYLWAILTPALGVTILVLIFTFAARQPPFGQSLALFFATGLLTFSFYSKLATSLMTVIESNKSLLLYPIVTQVSTILARFILVSITYFIIFWLFFGILFLLGLAEAPSSFLNLLFAFGLTALLGLAIGLVNLSFLSIWNSWKFAWGIINRPFFFLSGVFFVPSLLPESIIDILKWNPVMHAIEFIRNSYYPNYDSLVLNVRYLLLFSFILIFIGTLGERALRHKKN